MTIERNQPYAPGPTPDTVSTATCQVLTAPLGWHLLPPGDPGLTRRVKAAGDHWVVQEKRGRKVFSRGVWAPAVTIDRVRAELEVERSTAGHAKKKEAATRRRATAHAEYVEDFHAAVLKFLAFHPVHAALADRLAHAVTEHATPVGSGTVARTTRILVEGRAEAAVIAWMRHRTTGYDGMVIPRVKGQRREVRRMLAQRSKKLLERYRRGEPTANGCPLEQGLAGQMPARGDHSVE
jgi:hypothetical protein